MPSTPHIEFIVRGLIIHWGHCLVCWNPKGDYGYLPGGHIESGEPAAAALAREMLEETGLTCRVGPLLLAHENQFKTRKRAHHELNLVFAAEITDEAILAAGDELCHVAQLQKTAIPARQGRSKGNKAPFVPPLIASQEAHLAFRWLTPTQFKRADIRPGPMAKWTARLLADGLDSTVGMLATDAPTVQWMSTMRAPK